MIAKSDVPKCVICHPELDLDSNPVALCAQHTSESPIAERAIKRDPLILDSWIEDKRQEVRRART